MSRAIDVASRVSARANARVKQSSRACAARATARVRRRDALRATLVGLGLTGISSPSSSRAEGQPIDWLLKTTFDEDVDLVEIIKASAKGDAAAGSESWRREAAEKRRETAKEKATTTTDEEREPADVGKTATKFGKLGVILVLADVVTAAVMGKSVLGVAKSLEREMELDENGEVVEVKKVESGDWKDGIADKLMDRIKENQRIAEKGAEESED